jgi:hypothetical protein
MLHQLDWCMGRLPASGTVSRSIGINRGIRHSKDRPIADIELQNLTAQQLAKTSHSGSSYA